MTPMRKFFYYLAVFAAFLCLMQLPFAFAISSVFSNPNNIDTALKEGGVYENVISLVLEDVSKKNNDEGTKQILADKGFRDAITSSVQPDDIQAASQSAIGGIFAWLQGKTDQPEFTIDLSKPAKQATQKLAAYAERRATSLPPCTIQQLQTVNFRDDILSIPCLPPGVSAAQVGKQFTDQTKQQVELLKDPVIDSRKLLKGNDATQLNESQLPEVYQSLHSSKWFLLGLTVLLLSLLVFARRNRLAGLKYVGILLLVVGGLLGIVVVMSILGKANLPIPDDKVVGIATNTMLNLLEQIMAVIRWFVLGYIVLGIAALLAVHILKPKEQTQPTEIPEIPQPPKTIE
jgi:hypothetical protein